MGKYTVESLSRLQIAFNTLVPNIKYVPGVLANYALAIQLNQADTAKNRNKIKLTPEDVYKQSRRNESELKSEYAINPTFDEIIVSTPEQTYSFPLDPIVEVSFKNQILTTPITGGSDVVEMIGEANPAVRIRGILWEGTGQYPKKSLKELLQIFKRRQVLEVSSFLFNAMGIDSLVIEEVGLPALVGVEDTQPFEITAFGYKPVELEIVETQAIATP